jgi:Icc protein
MRIDHMFSDPLLEIPCVSTAPGGRGRDRWALPVLCALSQDLPASLDALLVTADLQCFDRDDVPVPNRRLMGEVLAEDIADLCAHGLLPAADRVGVILAGDLYAIPTLDKRGGLGDVQPQWDAFGRAFRWVAGVAGNHDTFQGRCEADAFRRRPGDKHLLTGDPLTLNLDGLTLGGLCGVIGNGHKPWRRSTRETTRSLRAVLAARPQILVLHEGPNIPDARLLGQGLVRDLIDDAPAPTLTICGHCHWSSPLAQTPGGNQVLNVDGRAVLIMRAAPSWFHEAAPAALQA